VAVEDPAERSRALSGKAGLEGGREGDGEGEGDGWGGEGARWEWLQELR
jgi:hypothetical protein